MHNSIKAALAAVAGGTLLLGGAGTLAYWNDSGTVGGADIDSGTLLIGAPVCQGWELDGGDPFTTQLLVPGDVLTQSCDFTIEAAGEHLGATFDVVTPTWDTANALTSELAVGATYAVQGTPVLGTDIAVVDDDVITAAVTVTFTGASATNASKTISAVLDDIVITATQAHVA
jgi:alternate signal-mediated exported protein